MDSWNRRDFLKLTTAGAAAGLPALSALRSFAGGAAAESGRARRGARVRVAFMYPPSPTFADSPDAWWSWPGNQYGAESHQKEYMDRLRKIADRQGLDLVMNADSVADQKQAQALAREVGQEDYDGLLLVVFYNHSLAHADRVVKAAEKAGLPTILYVGLGVHHGSVRHYRRPGLYFIQSLQNFEALASGLRMINARKLASQYRLLSFTDRADEPREGQEKFLGTTVRVLPYSRYAAAFEQVPIDDKARRFFRRMASEAEEVRRDTRYVDMGAKALENAARAHFALKKLLAEEQADGVTVRCLRLGMQKPCVSFANLNNELIPAACENDLDAAYTQMLGQLLTGRPGFQHNPCYDTERNHYFASHCTCPTAVRGPDGEELSYRLRPFLHSNEGSCAVEVLWEPDDPVTMVHYYPREKPKLDVYAGRAVASHPIPPAGGCATNVEVEITDRDDACDVRGHHNLIFCGDFAREFRLLALLHGMELVDTGYAGPWPG